MKKTEVKLRRTVNPEDVAKILIDLANSIKEGTVCLENGSDFVTLEAAEDAQIEMGLQAGQKKNKQKFELELSWRLAPPKLEGDESFKISSQEPEIVEPVTPEPEEGEEKTEAE